MLQRLLIAPLEFSFLIRFSFTVALLGAAHTIAAHAVVVKPDGSGDFSTIQAAIDALPSGSMIELADGIFQGDGNHNLVIQGKSMTLRSLSGNPNSCIIDCEPTSGDYCDQLGLSFGIAVLEAAASATILEGFTVRNAQLQVYKEETGCYYAGSGIYCDHSSPSITNVQLRECWVAGITLFQSGAFVSLSSMVENTAGIRAWGFSPTITDCIISMNSGATTSLGGGGVVLVQSGPLLENCTITGNSYTGPPSGPSFWPDPRGGVSLESCSNPTISNCQITGNFSNATGGGISGTTDCTLFVSNTVIAGNRSTRGGGIGGEILGDFQKCVVWDNCATIEGEEIFLTYGSQLSFNCCIVDSAGIDGSGQVNWTGTNLFIDPLFCESDCDEAPTTGGLYFLSSSSPAFNHPDCLISLPKGCETAVEPETWAKIKARYR